MALCCSSGCLSVIDFMCDRWPLDPPYHSAPALRCHTHTHTECNKKELQRFLTGASSFFYRLRLRLNFWTLLFPPFMSAVALWRSCHPVHILLVETSSSCVYKLQNNLNFSAVILNFFRFIWHCLWSVSLAHLRLAYLHSSGGTECVQRGLRLTWMAWPVNQSWGCITKVEVLFMVAPCTHTASCRYVYTWMHRSM